MSIGLDRLCQIGIGVQHQRTDLGAQEMIRAGGAHRRQLGQGVAADELQHDGAVVEMADAGYVSVAFALRNQPAYARHQFGGDGMALFWLRRHHLHASERGAPAGPLRQPFGGAIDGADRGVVAFLLRLSPGEQPMRAEHDAAGLGVPFHEPLQPHAELEAGTTPGHPADALPEDLACQRLAIGRGGNGDDRVRMHMIDMRMLDQPVQRRVDAGGARIEVEGQVRIEGDHVVLMLRTAIQRLRRQQLVQVQGREAVQFHAADIAARALHPKHRHGLAGQRIDCRQLGRGVAAAVVGDPLVRTEQVRAVEQQRLRRKAAGVGVIPTIRQKFGVHA